MTEERTFCDKCGARAFRPVFVNGGEFCGPCALAVVSDLIRSGCDKITARGGSDNIVELERGGHTMDKDRFLVRVFSQDTIRLEERHDELAKALSAAASAVGACKNGGVVDAYAVVYDYIPWGWRPITVYRVVTNNNVGMHIECIKLIERENE